MYVNCVLKVVAYDRMMFNFFCQIAMCNSRFSQISCFDMREMNFSSSTVWHSIQDVFLRQKISLIPVFKKNWVNGLCMQVNNFLIARLARSDPRNHFSVKNKKLPRAIYSILVYFTMFSFPVLTCSRIVSIHIILILNKLRHF